MRTYPKYKDSGVEWIGGIPNEWETKKLKYLFRSVGGGTPSTQVEEYWDGAIPWVSPKDMKFDEINNSEDKITEDGIVNSPVNLIESGYVIMVFRSGILRHSIPVGINTVPVTLNQDMKSFTPKNEEIDPKFFFHFVKGNQKNLLLEWSKQGATVESLETEFVENSSLPLPPLSEQKQIAGYLDRKTQQIDGLIEKTERKIALLKEQRASLINQCVTKGLNPNAEMKDSGVEWIGEIPKEWELTKSKFSLSVKYGFPFSANLFTSDEGTPILRIRDITTGRLETFYTGDYEEEYLLGEGSLLVGMDGDFNVRWWEGPKFLLNQRCCSLNPFENLNKRFLYYQLPYELKIINDTKHYSTVKHLSDKDMYNLTIVLPPLPEQKQIADHLDRETSRIDQMVGIETRRIDLLREYRQALISNIVTGKIDVRHEAAQ